LPHGEFVVNNIHLSISLRQANKKLGEQKVKISELTKYNGELVADQVVNEILWKERIAELEKENEALKNPVIQLVASKLALLNEPDVLTGNYRMQIMDGSWQVWTPIPIM
jgi:hypothetical protein